MKIGVTGHRKLPSPAQWTWVRQEVAAVVASAGRWPVGISSLAPGADQLFAEIVLEQKGTLEVILPFGDYQRTFKNASDLARFHRLRDAASRLEVLPDPNNDDQAYLAAGRRIVQLSERIIAIWDGLPARGVGGTAQIVEYARHRGVPLVHLNPIAATVSQLDRL